MKTKLLLVGLLTCGLARAQQPIWQLHGPADRRLLHAAKFVDHDHDGVADFLSVYEYYPAPWVFQARVGLFSGATGMELLWHEANVDPQHAGDVDGDGTHDIFAKTLDAAWAPDNSLLHSIDARRLDGSVLWTVYGPKMMQFAFRFLGDIDTDGDGKPNLVTIARGRVLPGTFQFVGAGVYVYNHRGTLLYQIDLSPMAHEPVSLAKMGDIDGDGADDFVVGCSDPQARGSVHLVSGRTGAILRTSRGLAPGDKTFDLVSNVGDYDGDGVADFAAFPWWSASRAMAVVWSGATGAAIWTLPWATSTVVTSEDFDRDGIQDMVMLADYVVAPSIIGSTFVISGRDGEILWRVNETISTWGGWGLFATALRTEPKAAYPTIVWTEPNFWVPFGGTTVGRIRAFAGAVAGQGPVTGTPCASSGPMPLIGARRAGSADNVRVTIAKAAPGAYAWLNVALGNPSQHQGITLPLALDPFGLVGCQMLVGPEITLFRQLGTAGIDRGYAAVDLPVQFAAVSGTIVQAQWIAYDPMTGWYGASEKHQLRLQ
jgi:hypothetical protein